MKEQTKHELVDFVSHLFITGTFLIILFWGIKTNHRLDALENAKIQNTECVSAEQTNLVD